MYSVMSKRRNSTPRIRGQLPGQLGLADPRGAGEQERADRLARAAQAGAGQLDGRAPPVHRLVLAEDRRAFSPASRWQLLPVVGGDRVQRDLGDARHHGLDDLPSPPRRRGLRSPRPQRERSAAPASSSTSMALSGRWRSLMCLADKLGGGLQGRVGVATPWWSSYVTRRPLRMAMRLLHRGLGHVDLLESPRPAPGPGRRTCL